MPSDELNSIPGLADKHQRALARRQVTDLRSLADADPQAIYRAMGSIRPRPTLQEISRWQDEARRRLGEAAPEETEVDISNWHTASSFAVLFAQRKVGDVWERRVEAERTEVEPEQSREVWPGWDCEPVCGWMVTQAGQAASTRPGTAGPGTAGPGTAGPASGEGGAQAESAGRPAAPAAPPAGLARLHIDRAVITDAARTADVVVAGALVANPPTELVAPVRVGITVSGGSPGSEVLAVTRVLRPDGPGWNPQDPVPVPRSGQAEFDLSSVPPGQHKISLLTWAPDCTAKPVSISLPTLTIRPEPAREMAG